MFCSNPHPLDCSICIFHSTLKRQCYIREVFSLLARAQILHLLIVLSCLSLFKKGAMKHNIFDTKLSPYEVSQNSQDGFFHGKAQDVALSVVQNKDTKNSEGIESTMLF